MRKTGLIFLAIAAFGVLRAQPTGSGAQHQNRAASLLLNHDYNAAIEALEQAASDYKEAAAWPYYFSCLNQITQAQIELGQLDAAKRSAKRALWQSIKTLSRNNDEAAKAAHKLGQVYEAAERYEDAMECHRMAFDIREALFSKVHPQIAASKVFMAITARKQGDYEQSAAFLEAAEGVLTRYYDTGHPEIAKVLEERGMLQELQGDTAQARSSFKQAIDILQAFPNQYPEALGRNWCRLARLLPEGQRGQAYQRAYHLFEANERMQSVFAAEAALELAQDALSAGQPALTIQMSKRALQHPEVQSTAGPLLANAYLLTGRLEAALIHYQEWIGSAPNTLQPSDWINAVETALLHQRGETALLWSKLYAERSNQQLARFYVARAYALLGNTVRARQIFRRLRRSDEPDVIKALAEEALGQLDLEEGNLEPALEHFRSGLSKVPKGHFSQLRLLAALGQAHTSLAAQDRHTIDNIEAAAEYFQALEKQLKHLLTVPLTPFEAAWLDQGLEQVITSVVQHLYLQQQYAHQDFSVPVAFQWFETAKISLLQLHAQRNNTAPAFWKYRAHRLEQHGPYGVKGTKLSSAVAQAWSRFQSKQADQQRYTLNELLPWAAFQELMAELKLGSYHYWVAEAHLYVLQLDAGGGRLYRTNWEASAIQRGNRIQERLSPQALFPDIQAFKTAGVESLVLFPLQKLAMLPFGQMEAGEGKRIGNTFSVYRHLCATTFAADRATADRLPSAMATAYVLHNEAADLEKKAAVALPTRNITAGRCASTLVNWLDSTGGFTRVQLSSQAIEARVLLCPHAKSALALSQEAAAQLKARYVVLDEAYTDYFGNSTDGLLNRVLSQQQFKGVFIEQQGLCSQPEVYRAWLDALSSGSDLIRKLSLLQREPSNEVLQSVHTFGAPYDLPVSNAVARIPVLWIIGGVFGLILAGLWVRR